MDYSRPIYWHEGLFLRPQHFQQQDQYLQNYAYGLHQITSPYLWGINSLNIIRPALNNQLLEIEKCELIFQDGSLISYPGNATVKRRNLEGLWDPSGKPMSIYLGLRKISAGKKNVSSVQEGNGKNDTGSENLLATTYCVSTLPTPTYDLYNEDKQDDLFYLDHNLQIFIDSEAAKAVDFCLIKIAELQRLGNEVKIVDQYIPPVLKIGASPILSALLREIKEQITARARELALYKRDKGLENIELGSRDMVYLLALMTLNRYAPLLHHLQEGEGASPWYFYGLLRQIVGELSTYSTQYNVFGGLGIEGEDGLPVYQHDNLARCFGMAVSMIIKLLDELTAGPDYIAPLNFDGTYFYSDLSDRIFSGNNKFYIRVRTNLPQEEVINEIQSVAKLSSREYLPILIARSLPGVSVEYDPSPPTELPRSTDSVYFRLDHHGSSWDAIRDGLNAAVYFDSPPGEIEVELMVIYGK